MNKFISLLLIVISITSHAENNQLNDTCHKILEELIKEKPDLTSYLLTKEEISELEKTLQSQTTFAEKKFYRTLLLNSIVQEIETVSSELKKEQLSSPWIIIKSGKLNTKKIHVQFLEIHNTTEHATHRIYLNLINSNDKWKLCHYINYVKRKKKIKK